MDANKIEDKFNIMLIGDINVGKTTILDCYFSKKNENEFTPLYKKPSLGIDNYSKIVKIENKNYHFKFWDTAGQEKYTQELTSNFYHLAHGFIIVFALNCKKSFENVGFWLNKISEVSSKKIDNFIILGNKSDLDSERVISQEDVEEKMLRLGIEIKETSAIKKLNIEESFSKIITQVHQSVYNKPTTSGGITLEKPGQSISQSRSGCCKS